MTRRLRARCNQLGCQARTTLPGTPENLHRLEHRDVACKKCGKGKLRRCNCDGVQWADVRNSPHTYGSPGCKYREDHMLESGIGVPGGDEPPF